MSSCTPILRSLILDRHEVSSADLTGGLSGFPVCSYSLQLSERNATLLQAGVDVVFEPFVLPAFIYSADRCCGLRHVECL